MALYKILMLHRTVRKKKPTPLLNQVVGLKSGHESRESMSIVKRKLHDVNIWPCESEKDGKKAGLE